MADLPPYKTPRWVKIVGIIAVVLILLFVILQFASGGDHGPRRHLPSGADLGGYTSYSFVIEDHISSMGYPGSLKPSSGFTEYGVQQR